MGFAELGQTLLRNNLSLKRSLRRINIKPIDSGLPAFGNKNQDPIAAARLERRIRVAEKKRTQKIRTYYIILVVIVINAFTLLAMILG